MLPQPTAGPGIGPAVRRRAGRLLAAIGPRHPARVIVLAFALAVLVSTLLLWLPAAHEAGQSTSFRTALFTATSATCVTGLTVVDTGGHWSTFGEVVIIASIQVGGFGIMTLASLLGLLVSRRLGLRTRLVTAAETRTLGLGDVRRVLLGVAAISLVVESVVAVLLGLRFWLGYGERPGRAAYLGVFHAVSSFNNAGFGLRSDNLVAYVSDPWVCLPLTVSVVLGGLGFPVLLELQRELRTPRRWSLHTKITLWASGILVFAGTLAVLVSEWGNDATLGRLSPPARVLAALVQGTMPRTAGFNSLDYGAMHQSTWLVTDALMFVGGGSASTAGGIKVTTFTVLLFAIVAEVRGDRGVEAFGRAIPVGALRQALTVALLGVAVVAGGTLTLLTLTGLPLDRVLFETVSAFGTVGLTTGITPTLPASAQYVLVALMFVGRTGTITLASALALRERGKLYALPEERPIVG